MPDLLGLEFLSIVSCYIGAGNQTWVIGKRNKCSQPPSQLFGPLLPILNSLFKNPLQCGVHEAGFSNGLRAPTAAEVVDVLNGKLEFLPDCFLKGPDYIQIGVEASAP